jgi:hypothetical protein
MTKRFKGVNSQENQQPSLMFVLKAGGRIARHRPAHQLIYAQVKIYFIAQAPYSCTIKFMNLYNLKIYKDSNYSVPFLLHSILT